jgi:hypothetical protein
VTIQGNVGTIGDLAFRDCYSLKTVTIQGNVKTIGTQAFNSCNNLETVTIQGNVGTIGGEVFYGCNSLETVTILGDVGSIGDQAFYYCYSLETVTIPGDVGSIGDQAFYNCSSLTSVTVTGGLVNGNITEKGTIDTFFKKDAANNWKLPDANTPISLTLRDILSLDYDPNSEDGKGGIAGDTGRKLYYSDAEYEWDGAEWKLVKCSVSGSLTYHDDGGPVAGATVYLKSDSDTYSAITDEYGRYIIRDIPAGTSGYITVSETGYAPTGTPNVSPLTVSVTGKNITLKIIEYKVSLAWGTGIGGFTYKVNNSAAVPYAAPITVNHGDTLVITAVPETGYEFKEWSSESEDNPSTIAVTEAVSLTAYASLIPVHPSSPDTYYSIAFDYDPNCTVYANGSPVSLSSSPLTVTYNGELTFTVNTPEGYTAYPSVVSGTADITLQADGRYKISDIRSDIHVTVSVSAGSGSGGGSDSGNMSDSTGGNDSGNYTGSAGDGNNSSDGDSYDGVSHWVPALAIAAFLACIIIAWMFLFFLKHRKDDEEEDGN